MYCLKLLKCFIIMSISVVLLSSFLFYDVTACVSQVRVTIPSFNVSINGNNIESRVMQYPMIVCDDITYFPLTWEWCIELGLISGYTDEDGLFIANYSSYIKPEIKDVDQDGYNQEGVYYTATIPTYPIYINGRLIDNTKEDYSFLNFRGITYFPLTWRFVIDEFGWDMSWNDNNGFKLSSQGMLTEYGPGEYYNQEYFYILKDYRDYSIIKKVTESWSMGTEPDEFGNYMHNNEGKTYSYLKLDYVTDTLTEIDFAESSDLPYNSGAESCKSVDKLFEALGNVLYFRNSALLDISDKAREGMVVDRVHAKKYTVNGMDVFALSVYFARDGNPIPAPYTPKSFFAFADNGNGALQQVKSWPSDHFLSTVYPYGSDGLYLCSDARHFGSVRYSNGRGWITIISSDMTEISLNDRWQDWNSIDALGMDDEGNLYLKSTWFPEYDLPNQYNGTVSLINDGFFRLNANGELTKIHPFIEANQITVTPNGNVYIDAGWTSAIIRLQTGARIEPN